MAKKKSKPTILGDFNFKRIDPYGGVETTQEAATRLHIESIMPDPEQPRSLLPTDLYERLYTGQLRPLLVLQEWLDRAAGAGASPAMLDAVAGVRQLAATIEHRDLINPITVREPVETDPTLPVGVRYMIVTGERRWWAHVLLTTEERPILGDQHPDRIKATVVPYQNIRALQLIENVAREDLSLLERALGMVALKDELSAETSKTTWTQVEEILGISRSYRSRILKILTLSPEAQELVSRFNLSEKTIRPINEHLQDNPKRQLQVLNQIIAWQKIEGEAVSYKRVNDFVKTLTQPTKKPARRSRPDDTSWWVARFQQRVTHTLKMLDNLDDGTFDEAVQIIGNGQGEGRDQLLQLREKLDRLLGSD